MTALRWRFAAKLFALSEDTGKILARICTAQCLTVRELMTAFAAEIPEEQILAAVLDLTHHGIVRLQESTPLQQAAHTVYTSPQ